MMNILMVEGWFFFSLLAAMLFAVTELFDKHFADTEVEDYVFGGAVYSLPLLLVLGIAGFVRGGIVYSSESYISGLIAGGLYSLILILYLRGVSQEDVSRFIPSLSLNTVIIAVLSVIFLGESLSLIVYIGMLVTVAGAFLISLEDPLKDIREFQSDKAVFSAVLVASIIALRDVIIKIGAGSLNIWTLIFWIGLGGLVTSVTVLLVLRRNKIQEIFHMTDLMAVGGLRSLGYMSYMVSLSLGSVTLASAVLKTNGMFVFIGATVLSFSDRLVQEKRDRRTIIQKFLASSIIIFGVVLMKIFSG